MTNPFGYDLWHNGNDLDPGMRETGGNLVLAQWAARCLQTPKGQLLDDPQYGYDITQWINQDVEIGAPQVAQIKSGITKALLRDERILSVNVTAVFMASQNLMVVTVQLVTATGPFVLVLQVTEVNVTILQPTQG